MKKSTNDVPKATKATKNKKEKKEKSLHLKLDEELLKQVGGGSCIRWSHDQQ
jgi:hypothetical protein